MSKKIILLTAVIEVVFAVKNDSLTYLCQNDS